MLFLIFCASVFCGDSEAPHVLRSEHVEVTTPMPSSRTDEIIRKIKSGAAYTVTVVAHSPQERFEIMMEACDWMRRVYEELKFRATATAASPV